MTRPLLDAGQAGELLNVPKGWVLAEARADRIPHVRLGRYVRFETDLLEEWWRSRARGPVGSAHHKASGRGGAGTPPGLAHEENAS